mgnify:FL=1
MDIVLSPKSLLPIYKQIEECIKSDILSRKLKGDEPLPSIRQLASSLKISVITIKNAYEELEKDGFIYSCPGKGFYVCSFTQEQLRLYKKAIVKQTIENQMSYLRRMGISEEEIKDVFKNVK